MDLKQLQKEIPHKWRVQSFSKRKPTASVVAYIDARDVMNILDEVVGPENWQSNFQEVDGKLFAGIGIQVDGQWIWKWDTGAESNIEKEKGEVSDGFKRAGVKWGVGRFLYDMKVHYVKASETKKEGNHPYVVDDNGNRVWDITEYINNLKS